MSTLADQFAAVREVMSQYGAGQIDTTRAATLLMPAYRDAIRVRAGRTYDTNQADPDAASVPGPWAMVAVARQTGVVTAAQYAALADALALADGQVEGEPVV
jgi:hypothetical protein